MLRFSFKLLLPFTGNLTTPSGEEIPIQKWHHYDPNIGIKSYIHAWISFNPFFWMGPQAPVA